MDEHKDLGEPMMILNSAEARGACNEDDADDTACDHINLRPAWQSVQRARQTQTRGCLRAINEALATMKRTGVQHVFLPDSMSPHETQLKLMALVSAINKNHEPLELKLELEYPGTYRGSMYAYTLSLHSTASRKELRQRRRCESIKDNVYIVAFFVLFSICVGLGALYQRMNETAVFAEARLAREACLIQSKQQCDAAYDHAIVFGYAPEPTSLAM